MTKNTSQPTRAHDGHHTAGSRPSAHERAAAEHPRGNGRPPRQRRNTSARPRRKANAQDLDRHSPPPSTTTIHHERRDEPTPTERAWLLTPTDAATLLAVRESWLRRKASQRAIPCTFLGKHLRFTQDDLHEIIRRHHSDASHDTRHRR